MTLQSYLRILRERWRLIVLALVVCIGAAVLITAVTPKTYESSVQVFVTSNVDPSDASGRYDQVAAAQSQVSTFASLIDSPTILDGVRSDLHLDLSNSALGAKITASAPSQQTLVDVTATDSSAAMAASIATSAAKHFITYVENLQTPSSTTTSTVALTATSQAQEPSSPVSPNPGLNIALGVVLGVLLGIALAVARDVLDNRIKQAESLAALTGAPVMGVVVDDPLTPKQPIAARAGEQNVRAENFRQLRANLQFADLDHHPRIIAVTSSMPTEGKSMVAINLAAALAEAGFTVCLVDADLRRPTVAKTLGLTTSVGLTSVLIQQVSLPDALQTAGKNLYVLASGPTPPNPSEVLASTYVRDVVRSLLDMVDYIVLDTAPLLPVADGSEVAALAEGTLLVARNKLTTEAQVKRSVGALTRVNARLIGVVLNAVPAKRSNGYGYGYGYGYYRETPSRGRASARAKSTHDGEGKADRSFGQGEDSP